MSSQRALKWKRVKTAKLKPGFKAFKMFPSEYITSVGKVVKPRYNPDQYPEVIPRSEDIFWRDM